MLGIRLGAYETRHEDCGVRAVGRIQNAGCDWNWKLGGLQSALSTVRCV